MVTKVKNTKTPEQWGEEYKTKRDDYKYFTSKIKNLLKELLKSEKIDYINIESRTKKIDRFIQKIHRKGGKYNNPLIDITDLSGIRIITSYKDDVDNIIDLIEKQFKVDRENTVDKSKKLAPNEFGYLSVQYIINIDNKRSKLSEWKYFSKFKAEIQIRTLLQHAWSVVEHKINYSSVVEAPDIIKRRLFRLSALFELSDDEFLDIKNKSIKAEEESEKNIDEGKLKIEINRGSLLSYFNKTLKQKIWVNKAIKIGFGNKNVFSLGHRKAMLNITRSEFFIALNILNIKTIEELDIIFNNAEKWGEKLLVNYLNIRKKSEKDVVYAYPYKILLYLVLYEKRDLINKEILNKIFYEKSIKNALNIVLKMDFY